MSSSKWTSQGLLSTLYGLWSLSSRTDSTKVLGDKAFNIAPKLQSMVDSKVVFLQWFTNFFIKKIATQGSRIVYEEATKTSKNKQKKQHKVIIRKIKKREVYLSFEDNICWAA